MTRTTLNLDALAVETFPTTAAPPPALDEDRASRTSCRPPYCTC